VNSYKPPLVLTLAPDANIFIGVAPKGFVATPFDKELIESTFHDILRAVAADREEEARRLVPKLRELLDRAEPNNLDETIDWVSEEVTKIKDPALFDKTIDFLVNNDLAE
jgi:hypothetical protein